MTGRSPVYVGGKRLDIIVARGQVISKPAGRHAGPALKEAGEVSVIREAQQVGYFLNGHFRRAQKILCNCQLSGQVIMIGRHMKGFFKQMNRTGIGKMYLCSDICDVERCSQILLDVGFHDLGGRGIGLQSV